MQEKRLHKVLGYDPKTSFNQIYALCDFELLIKNNISFEEYLQICEKYCVKIIQYRDKVSNSIIKKDNLLKLKSLTSIPIIINDDLSLVEFCDGIHLGQEDFAKIHQDKNIAIKLIRLKIKNRLLGLSTHNELEVLEANSLDLDMIGLGAYRETSTKDVSTIVGEKAIYLSKISKHPICLIGGVTLDDKLENIPFKVIGSGLFK